MLWLNSSNSRFGSWNQLSSISFFLNLYLTFEKKEEGQNNPIGDGPL